MEQEAREQRQANQQLRSENKEWEDEYKKLKDKHQATVEQDNLFLQGLVLHLTSKPTTQEMGLDGRPIYVEGWQEAIPSERRNTDCMPHYNGRY